MERNCAVRLLLLPPPCTSTGTGTGTETDTSTSTGAGASALRALLRPLPPTATKPQGKDIKMTGYTNSDTLLLWLDTHTRHGGAKYFSPTKSLLVTFSSDGPGGPAPRIP